MTEPIEALHVAALKAMEDNPVRILDKVTPLFDGNGKYIGFRVIYAEDGDSNVYYLTRDFIADLEAKLLVTWDSRKDYLEYLYTNIPDEEFKTELGSIVPVNLRNIGLCGDWMARRADPETCLRALHAMGKLEVGRTILEEEK